MPRQRTDSRTFTTYRQRTMPGLNDQVYRVVFTWTEGSPRIEVRFQGDEAGFDAPAVYDHEKGEVTISTGEEFMERVREYWAALDDHDLLAHWNNRRE